MKKEVLEWVKTIVFSVVIALVIMTFVRPTLVKGYSMYPTLKENDYLIMNKLFYKMSQPHRGDIVVFKSHILREDGKEKDLVKRIIGLEGDHIKVTDGKVYRNEKLLKEKYINGDYTIGDVDVVVPKDKIFAMGDNRPNSMDSRDPRVGLVDKKNIIGKVFVRLFPFNKIQLF